LPVDPAHERSRQLMFGETFIGTRVCSAPGRRFFFVTSRLPRIRGSPA
jgi:hypothetical protein